MRITLCLVAVALAALPAAGSHLTEKQVVTLEDACEKLRQEKLAPEKATVLRNCLASGEYTQAECEAQAGAYGEIQTGAIRRLGKYYDLPECEEAYRAREHYNLNPGR